MTTLIKTTRPNGWLSSSGSFRSPFSLIDDMLKNDFFPGINRDLLEMDFSTHMPAVNIAEEPGRYLVELSAPGFSKESFKVELQEGNLVISAENKQETKSEDKKYSRREFSYGTFRKSFNLPEDVQKEHIAARYENGILVIELPRANGKEEAKSTTIVVG